MKRFISALMVLLMILSLSFAVMAEGDEPVAGATTYTDQTTATFEVSYTATSGTQPEETFTFTAFTCTSVTDAADGVTTDNAPVPDTIAGVTLNSTTTSGTATINLPTYTSVGVYTYTFNQIVGTTSGVTYYKDDAVQNMSLVVTVVEQNGKVRVAAVHVEAGTASTDKTGEITNTYDSGTLAVSKTVTGLLGDKTKEFSVTVEFTPADGEEIKSAITFNGGSFTEAQSVDNNKATFNIKHGQTITFSNIPVGVTWKVTEDDYSSDGYTTTYSKQTDTMTNAAATCAITNDKGGTPDTGIILDSLPYILICLFAVVGTVILIVRRSRKVED